MASNDNPQKERTVPILVGVTPEKYAQMHQRDLSAYEQIFVSSSAYNSPTPREAEEAIQEDALEKRCEVILNLIPTSSYSCDASQLKVYLVGMGLKPRKELP
jgi:hypothetical protein